MKALRSLAEEAKKHHNIQHGPSNTVNVYRSCDIAFDLGKLQLVHFIKMRQALDIFLN